MNVNVLDLMSSHYSEPSFFVNFYKIARTAADEFTYKIQKTNNLLSWRIQDDQLVKIGTDAMGIFFDSETYIIQWLFDLKIDNTLVEEVLVYYWRGQNAVKGFSPLPPHIEEHCPVERLVQWSEPALFFHAFPTQTIVFYGPESNFNADKPHLLLVRGELLDEIHLYEVPCKKESLRSKATFLLIVPQEKLFLYWYGVAQKKVNITQPDIKLRQWQSNWANFSVQKMQENDEVPIFLETLEGSVLDYLHLEVKEAEFSPKLFYLNSITGSFSATNVEYPLRAEGVTAPFPFLQSHLYTATQPALFLLDNNTEIWLWEGVRDPDSKDGKFEEELKLAQELARNYAKEKDKLLFKQVSVKHVYALKEPVEYKNIFPFWKE